MGWLRATTSPATSSKFTLTGNPWMSSTLCCGPTMIKDESAGDFLLDLDPRDWSTDDSFFDDSRLPRRTKQKGEGDRAVQRWAVALILKLTSPAPTERP